MSSTSSVQVLPVTTPGDRELFVQVPWIVYANDPNWVPPLRSSVAQQLEPSNPFFQYGRLQAFVAVQDGRPIGRIVAAVNDRLVEREQQPIGLFGFFECIHDFEVAQRLFDHAKAWLRSQGMTRIRGPIDLSTHNNCLLLVDGFDSPPMVMMPYNPPYYPQFMEQAGWHKAKDAYAYDFPVKNHHLTEQFAKGYRIALKSGITFRPIHTKGEAFQKDCESLYHLFNTCFADNWSSTPRTLEEFLAEAQELRSLVDPDAFPIAEDQGQMVGFWMALPDYNMALKHVNGKLDFLGILKFLWFRRQINQARVIALCALPEYRSKLIPLGLIYLGMQCGSKKGKPYQRAELSWVYEDNMPSRKLIEASGGTIYKTYRIYEADL